MLPLRHLFCIVFCLSLTLRCSFASPPPDARKEALSAIFDYLQKRLHEQSVDDEMETEDAIAEAEESVVEQDVADFGEVGEASKREVMSLSRRVSFDSPVMAAATKLDAKQIQAILDLHKKDRIAPGGNDEMAMTWDDDLAKLAQGLSDSCHWGHANMKLPDGTKTGQNIAYWSDPATPIGKLVQLWMDEKKDYNIQSGACAGGKVCGHYTQMVWSESTKVGCGATKCPGMGIYLVCDYTPAGNFLGKKAVHLGGAPCSKCNLYPGTACDDGLCSVCDPKKRKDCRPYDASTCIDAKKDPNVGDCSWVKPYCTQAMYRQWLEESCAKTCGYCRS